MFDFPECFAIKHRSFLKSITTDCIANIIVFPTKVIRWKALHHFHMASAILVVALKPELLSAKQERYVLATVNDFNEISRIAVNHNATLLKIWAMLGIHALGN